MHGQSRPTRRAWQRSMGRTCIAHARSVRSRLAHQDSSLGVEDGGRRSVLSRGHAPRSSLIGIGVRFRSYLLRRYPR
eukprot:scaffold14247_cov140-Isochrysis_galbana.AAC.2